jgi:hypothetical protein
MGKRGLVVSKGRKVGLFLFLKEFFFVGVGWGGWRKGVGIYIFLFYFILFYFIFW